VARIISFTDARARLSELLDDVEARHEHVVITRKGLPSAVVVPAEEWRAIGETLDVLRDEQTLADLRESAKDLKADRLSATVEATSGGSKLRLTRRAKNQLSALPKTTQDAVLGTLLLIQREPATIGSGAVGSSSGQLSRPLHDRAPRRDRPRDRPWRRFAKRDLKRGPCTAPSSCDTS
jgi:antitoxin YefM